MTQTHTHTHTHTHTPGNADTHRHTHTHLGMLTHTHTHTPGNADTHTHTHTPGNAESTGKNAGEMLKEPQAFKPCRNLRLVQLRPHPSRSRDKCPLSALL